MKIQAETPRSANAFIATVRLRDEVTSLNFLKSHRNIGFWTGLRFRVWRFIPQNQQPRPDACWGRVLVRQIGFAIQAMGRKAEMRRDIF
jgi:hypothetical protein